MNKSKIKAFFAEYERRFNDSLAGKPLDVNAMTADFAEYIVGSGPTGVMGGKNDETYRQMIRGNEDRYRKIGAKYMKVTNIEVTELDDLHAAAKVYWDSGYNKNGELITIGFYVIYILTFVNNDIKIFAFISGDEEKVLKEHGLVVEEKS
ncbi:hypothetical protein ACFOTA_19170 [Chitinophaga sp. GCM10012297]|uniref:Nuclear transport factor 2 family protein n=1 Tax=Chitinophaga chungangae TaxID=2821488 RepID=A0ABS3YJP2_9BACT|nr:hypothetical protein [Chitinophaga chungangae]MBO9154344.1 hypothetical protein [Chitinophaga chungangae]